MFESLSIASVLISTVVVFGFGMLWYSKFALGTIWFKHLGLSQETMDAAQKKGMVKAMILGLLSTIVMIVVFNVLAVTTFFGIFSLAFLLFVGFIIPTIIGPSLWQQQSWVVTLINLGYQLGTLLLIALTFNLLN